MSHPYIHGIDADERGRCAHWHADHDVIANKCATCGEFFACYKCHNELRDHALAPMPLDELSAMCGACGHLMTYDEYHVEAECPQCGHAFNPGCQTHAHLYFAIGADCDAEPGQ